MGRRFDTRTAAIIIGAALVGAAWAYYNYVSTGGQRGEPQLRPLVWAIFATPFATFLGWLAARRREGWLAAYVCFCIYFFTPFVGARIESLVMDATQAEAEGHWIYFHAVIVLNLLAALAVAVWRGLKAYAAVVEPPSDAEARQAEAQP
jgi:hypothetical protein